MTILDIKCRICEICRCGNVQSLSNVDSVLIDTVLSADRIKLQHTVLTTIPYDMKFKLHCLLNNFIGLGTFQCHLLMFNIPFCFVNTVVFC